MKLTILNRKDFIRINNSITKLNLNIKIEKIILSVITDNEFKEKKLRNYKRNELLLLILSKFKIEYNLINNSGLFDNDKINMKIYLENFALYNQISKFGKFSCVCKNISSPMSYIENEILNYKKSSMSKINNFGFKMGKLKLNIDPEFIEEVINFFENILYRMEIINFNVDELFLRYNRDLKIKEQYKNYQKENSICYSTNISFPEIDINFELTENNLAKLLYEKAGCSDFFVWLGYGLVGKEQNLFLNKPRINSHLGSFNNLIQKILSIYNDQLSSEITNIGLKGLWGQIQKLFVNQNKTSKNCIEVQKNRYRVPRAFYGKYKYFRIYNENDAIYFNKLEKKYNLEQNGIYIHELLKGEQNIYVFTNNFIFVFENINYKECFVMEYASIYNVKCNNEKVTIYLNEEGKKKYKHNNELFFICENNAIADKIVKMLKDKYRNNY